MKKLLLLLGLFGLFLSACTNGKKGVTTASLEGELKPLSLGVMPTMDGLPFIIAQKKGIYDSLGVKVDLIRFNSANDRDAALQSGQIDGAITDYPSAAVLQARHINLALVMKNNGYFCFIVSKQSRINSFKQLTKRNIAVSRNTLVEYATDLLLSKTGIHFSKVNKPEIAQIPLRLQMLQYGQLDATFLPDPFASIAMNNGHRSLISTQELGVNLTATAFTGKALKEKTEQIKLLIRGYNLGVEYIRTHSQKEWKQLLIDELEVPSHLTGLIALPPYESATRPVVQEIEKAVAWLKALDRIPDSYQGENLVDTTFITLNPL